MSILWKTPKRKDLSWDDDIEQKQILLVPPLVRHGIESYTLHLLGRLFYEELHKELAQQTRQRTEKNSALHAYLSRRQHPRYYWQPSRRRPHGSNDVILLPGLYFKTRVWKKIKSEELRFEHRKKALAFTNEYLEKHVMCISPDTQKNRCFYEYLTSQLMQHYLEVNAVRLDMMEEEIARGKF